VNIVIVGYRFEFSGSLSSQTDTGTTSKFPNTKL